MTPITFDTPWAANDSDDPVEFRGMTIVGIDRAIIEGSDYSAIRRFTVEDIITMWNEIRIRAEEAGVWYETTTPSHTASGELTSDVIKALSASDAPSLGGQSTDMSPMLSKNHNKKGR